MSFLRGVYFIAMELQSAIRQIIGQSLRRISDYLLYPPPEQTGPSKEVGPPTDTSCFREETPLQEPRPRKPRKPYEPTKHNTHYYSSINILRYMLEPENQGKKFRISELSGPNGEGPSQSTNRSTQRACDQLAEKGVLSKEGVPAVHGIIDLQLARRTIKEYEVVLGDKGPPSGDDTTGKQEVGPDETSPESLLPRQGEGEGHRNPFVS